MATKKAAESEIFVQPVFRKHIDLAIIGTSPLICNSMSAKTAQTLLLPPVKKNAAAKASTLKHDPLTEFRNSMYLSSDPQAPTAILAMASAVKGALRGAALDIPGSSKSQIGRLTYVNGDYLGIFGIPQMLMSIVRSADMARTPDVRTRAIVPEWACIVRITFVDPLIKQEAICNLLEAAGITQGLGDWRAEKGKGSFGGFQLIGHEDERLLKVMAEGGRDAQLAAIENPQAYDDETEKLLTWFTAETARRGFVVAA